MSLPRKVNVTCPECKKAFQTTVFDSINTDYSPNIAESIISGELFDVKCPHCGNIAHLEYDVLYHDIERGAMIWLLHPQTDSYEGTITEIRATKTRGYKTTRIVSDVNELREKVACLEAGVDDCVIELCKVFIEAQLLRQNPDFHLRNSFYTYAGGKHIVFIYDTTGKEMSCYLEDELYGMIEILFKKPLMEMSINQYSIINHSWAVDFFNELPDTEQSDDEITSYEKNGPIQKEAETELSEEKPRAQFCRKCGAKLISDSIYCGYCGTKVVY